MLSKSIMRTFYLFALLNNGFVFAQSAEPGQPSGYRLPVKINLQDQDTSAGLTATGWDFDGDGRPDFVRVDGNIAADTENRAYDFDGDGKPDFFRKSVAIQKDGAAQ